jgi:hypothetical protein
VCYLSLRSQALFEWVDVASINVDDNIAQIFDINLVSPLQQFKLRHQALFEFYLGFHLWGYSKYPHLPCVWLEVALSTHYP